MGDGRERGNLAYGDLIEVLESIALWMAHVDKLGVHAFDICKDEELQDAGVGAHVALEFGIRLAPLPGGLAKKRDIEQVGLVRIGDSRLSVSDLGGNQMLPHRRRVDAVVELGERAIEIPSEGKALALVVFQTLKLLDQIELKLRAEPRTELEGDVTVGVCTAVTACTGDQSLPASCIDPFLC